MLSAPILRMDLCDSSCSFRLRITVSIVVLFPNCPRYLYWFAAYSF